MKMAIYYGSSTGNTERGAELKVMQDAGLLETA